MHPAEPKAANSFVEFQARCKIVSVFQERISFPGNWQVPDGEGGHPFPM